jgi:signal recognition particle subunit SRP19
LRGRGRLLIWPSYFDVEYSTSQGRRVPKSQAIRGVKSEEIFQAAEDLGLKPVIKPASAYSKRPWLKTGVVLVDKTGPKTKILEDVLQKIKVNRAKKRP